MQFKDKRITVLGIGNLLFSDEGMGVHAVQALEKMELPANVTTFDGNTLGILCAPYIADSDFLILIDAVDAPGEPGDVKIYEKEEILLSKLPLKLSPHQVGIQETITLCELREECPDKIIFIGVIPASYDASVELTESGKKALEKVLDLTLKLIKAEDYNEALKIVGK